MSELVIGGRPWAAGLAWRPRTHRASEARTARRFDCPWLVRSGTRTGFADRESGDAEGLVSLAAALAGHLTDPAWIAALESDDGGTVAVVRFEDGEILPDGDEVFTGRESALDAIERWRLENVAVHVTPALPVKDARTIDIGLVGVSEAMRLRPVPAGGRSGLAAMAAACLLAAAATAGWLHKEDIVRLIHGEEEVAAEPLPPPQVKVAIAGAALIGACDRALRSLPAGVPAWRTERIECTASLQDPGILDAWPQFRNRPALVVRWSLDAGHDPEIGRRLMEEHLTRRWQLSSVIGAAAWSVAELEPVLAEWTGGSLPPFLRLRETIDRAAGPWAASLTYRRNASEPWTVVLTGPAPLSRAFAALDGIEGLEITRLLRTADSDWRIDGRALTPRLLPEEAFTAINTPLFDDLNEVPDGHV